MFFPSSVSSLVFSHLTVKCPFMTFFASALLGLWSLLNLQVDVFVNSGRFWLSSLQIFIPILFIYTERENRSLLSHRSLRLCSFCVCVPFYIQASDWIRTVGMHGGISDPEGAEGRVTKNNTALP